MIMEQYARAKEIITQHRSALDMIGAALIEHETIEGKHVKEILEFGEIRSPIVNEPLSRQPDKSAKKPTDKPAAAPDPLEHGGATPAPTPA